MTEHILTFLSRAVCPLCWHSSFPNHSPVLSKSR